MIHLIIGASGLIGGNLLRAIQNTQEQVVGTCFSDHQPGLLPLNILDRRRVIALLDRVMPDVVYLPAANPNVEWCEENPEDAHEINVGATLDVADAAISRGIKVVFFSSEYVFDGKNGPYSEGDAPCPVSVYGSHKLLVEDYLLGISLQSLIIRTTVVYGLENKQKNFVYRLIHLLRSEKTIKVPADQISSPTYAKNAAELTVGLVGKQQSGIFNVAGRDVMSRYEFALKVAEAFNLNSHLIIPVITGQLSQKARRPLCAGLTISKAAEAAGIPVMGVEEGLVSFRNDIICQQQTGEPGK